MAINMTNHKLQIQFYIFDIYGTNSMGNNQSTYTKTRFNIYILKKKKCSSFLV